MTYTKEREDFFKPPSADVRPPGNGKPPIHVGFKRLSENAVLPTKAHATDSGFDLYASADVIIEPGATVIVPTDIAVDLPAGYEAQIRPRSGVTAKTKLRVQLGTIDNGFTGGIGVICDNTSVYADLLEVPSTDGEYVIFSIDGKYHHCSEKTHLGGSYIIRKGDRIAQLVIQRLPDVVAVEVEDVGVSDRGAGGFGSTGV